MMQFQWIYRRRTGRCDIAHEIGVGVRAEGDGIDDGVVAGCTSASNETVPDRGAIAPGEIFVLNPV